MNRKNMNFKARNWEHSPLKMLDEEIWKPTITFIY